MEQTSDSCRCSNTENRAMEQVQNTSGRRE